VDPSVRPQPGWSPGQTILNSTRTREPQQTFPQPVPIVARNVWADDGDEYPNTVALGWTGRNAYVRMPDRRYQFTAVWLNAADITRR
jgi:hypothetical protein